jgi:hypothetical protein
MNQSRKTWASAAVVGVILVGGVSVAAAASAGRLDQARETRAVVQEDPTFNPQPTPDATGRVEDGIVVSEELESDPDGVVGYWTDDRLQEAQPMPMPEVKPGELVLPE